MKRVSISFELGHSTRYDAFFRRLQCLGAFPVMNSQWVLQTPFTVEQIEKELRTLIDPADRLLVTCTGVLETKVRVGWASARSTQAARHGTKSEAGASISASSSPRAELFRMRRPDDPQRVVLQVKLPVLKPRQVIAALERGGFYVHHQKGSHARLLHNTRPELHVTAPMHDKHVPPSLLKHRILKQTGLTEEEF